MAAGEEVRRAHYTQRPGSCVHLGPSLQTWDQEAGSPALDENVGCTPQVRHAHGNARDPYEMTRVLKGLARQ